MRWTGLDVRVDPHDPKLVSVSMDLPDRTRPKRTDVRDHLLPYLGRPDYALRATPGGPLPVEVNIVWPSAERPWITAYTVGASSRAMTVTPEASAHCSPYAELFLRLPPTWVPERRCPLCSPPRVEREPLADARTKWPFEWLLFLAELPHREKTFLGAGHVVEVVDAPAAAEEHGLPFSGFHVEPGWDEIGDRPVPPLVRAGGERVDFLAVVPLHPAEVRWCREGRQRDVLRALDAANVTELLVADRLPCV